MERNMGMGAISLLVACATAAGVALAADPVESAFDSLLRAGVEAYRAGNFERAIATFTEVTEADPTNDRAFAYLGNVLYRQGGGPFGQPSYSRATPQAITASEKAFLSAIALSPANPRYLSNLAAIYGEGAGRWEPAVVLFKRAAALAPTDGTLQKNADSAEIYWKKQKMEDELIAIARAIDDDGAPPLAAWNASHPGRERRELWDVPGQLLGTNYSEKAETLMRMVFDERPGLWPAHLAVLRAAHAAQPDFGATAHALASMLLRRACGPLVKCVAPALRILQGLPHQGGA